MLQATPRYGTLWHPPLQEGTQFYCARQHFPYKHNHFMAQGNISPCAASPFYNARPQICSKQCRFTVQDNISLQKEPFYGARQHLPLHSLTVLQCNATNLLQAMPFYSARQHSPPSRAILWYKAIFPLAPSPLRLVTYTFLHGNFSFHNFKPSWWSIQVVSAFWWCSISAGLACAIYGVFQSQKIYVHRNSKILCFLPCHQTLHF